MNYLKLTWHIAQYGRCLVNPCLWWAFPALSRHDFMQSTWSLQCALKGWGPFRLWLWNLLYPIACSLLHWAKWCVPPSGERSTNRFVSERLLTLNTLLWLRVKPPSHDKTFALHSCEVEHTADSYRAGVGGWSSGDTCRRRIKKEAVAGHCTTSLYPICCFIIKSTVTPSDAFTVSLWYVHKQLS